ncbi:histidine kinase [Streptomyces sp. NPDC093970]|uniref:sensor histidine kinase n=1 Tax=Streptomyces sp. NPDC093970 TaxID=3155076 RepID=UPI003420AED9
MTETTHAQAMPPEPPDGAFEPYKPRSPEVRAALDALGRLRRDLFQDAFAYRPLPPLSGEGRVRRLSARTRRYAVWAPHIVVAAAGGSALLVAVADRSPGSAGALPAGLVALAPVLLTLARPVAAFWLSLVATWLGTLLSSSWDDWPWTAGNFISHLVVLTVVAARTRPRTAAWMWVITAFYGFSFVSALGWNHYSNDVGPMLVVSAIALLTVGIRQIRREAEQTVTAQQSETAHERSRRTLLEERTTIARELHDVVAHHMSVVAIQAEAAPYRVENPPPELEKAFVTIRENAVAALTELRRVLGVVRAEDDAAPDAPQPTLADLDALLANVREAGLSVDKGVTGAVRELPQGVELSAYRIVQEALSNTLRHAPGASARVEIGYVIGGLGLRVVNGPPPRPALLEPSPGAGHGITGMRERVSMLNGAMTAAPTGDGGYEVTVFLPVAPPAEDEA